MITEFLDSRRTTGLKMPGDVKAFIVQLFNKLAFDRHVAFEEAEQFVGFQTIVVAMGSLGQILPKPFYMFLSSTSRQYAQYVLEMIVSGGSLSRTWRTGTGVICADLARLLPAAFRCPPTSAQQWESSIPPTPRTHTRPRRRSLRARSSNFLGEHPLLCSCSWLPALDQAAHLPEL
mmetsp:Transcript_114435/g.369882  ORF Transcript_114435/g.369882 Transcript_114435/m.369882 type:complete len:176 (-) Transcript_114435:1003-1530(-)